MLSSEHLITIFHVFLVLNCGLFKILIVVTSELYRHILTCPSNAVQSDGTFFIYCSPERFYCVLFLNDSIVLTNLILGFKKKIANR